MHIKSHLGSHKCSHPGDQWPHAASLIGPVTHLTNLAQSHTNTQHRCPPHPYPCGSSQTQPGVLRVFTPGHSQAQPGERFGGDPQRNTNFKQTLHNTPRREAWGCCAVGDLEDVASNPLFAKQKGLLLKDRTEGGVKQWRLVSSYPQEGTPGSRQETHLPLSPWAQSCSLDTLQLIQSHCVSLLMSKSVSREARMNLARCLGLSCANSSVLWRWGWDARISWFFFHKRLKYPIIITLTIHHWKNRCSKTRNNFPIVYIEFQNSMSPVGLKVK